MSSVALVSLRNIIAELAEETLTTSGSQPSSMVSNWIVESISQYEIERSGMSEAAEKVETVTTTSAATPLVATFPANQIVALGFSPAPKSIKSVWLIDGGARVRLEPLAESDRGTPWAAWGNSPGRPEVYDVIETSGNMAMALRLWPPAGSAYSLEVTYYPEPTLPVLDNDLWYYVPGTQDCVVCDVVMRILERNDEADSAQYAMLRERKDRAYRFLRMALRQRDTGAQTPRDVRGARYAAARARRWV